MSDEIKKDQGAQGAADPLVNLKAEMQRKLDAMQATIAKQNEELLARLTAANTQSKQQKVQQQEEDLSDLLITDPQRAASIIEERAEKRVMSKLEASQKQQQKQQGTLAELTSAYPELQHNDHELTQLAIQKYNSLADEDKVSPLAYKLAVKEAAMELGIKERSKRAEGEDFVPSRSSGKKERKKESLDPATEAFARILAERGYKAVDPDDPKVRERLIQNAQRNFSKYR